MLPCKGCGYSQRIPGNEHIRCIFDWSKVGGHPYKLRRWFSFPFNYDPMWGPDECAGRSETIDVGKVAPSHPLLDIISLMG
jgi:hypothetical protein